MQNLNEVKEMQSVQEGIAALSCLKSMSKEEAEAELLHMLTNVDAQLPELMVLQQPHVVRYLVETYISDEKTTETISMEKLEAAANHVENSPHKSETQQFEAAVDFIHTLRRALHQVSSRDIESLEVSEPFLLYNIFSEMDMILWNSRNFEQAQGLFVDVLYHVDMEDDMKENYLRYYADCFDMLENQASCRACYQSLIKRYPTSPNMLYGWMLQLKEWEAYEECMPLFEQGLQMKDTFYAEAILELAEEVARKTGNERFYQSLQKTYGKKMQSVGKRSNPAQHQVLPLPLASYENAASNKPCPCGSGKKFKACCAKIIQKMN